MNEKITLDKFATVGAVILLLFMTALGNAAVMLAAAIIALSIGWALYSKQDWRRIAIPAATGLVVALVISIVMHWRK